MLSAGLAVSELAPKPSADEIRALWRWVEARLSARQQPTSNQSATAVIAQDV
jgi:hypothetical protein